MLKPNKLDITSEQVSLLVSSESKSQKQIESLNESSWSIDKEDTVQVAPGVRHSHQLLRNGKFQQSIHILQVDSHNQYITPIVFSSKGKVEFLETVGNMQKELIKVGKNIIAGVNGDFFSWLGVPTGLQICNGEIFTSPSTIKVLLAIMANGQPLLKDQVKMNATISFECGYKMPIESINRTRYLKHTDHAFLYNDRFGSSTRTPEGVVEIVIKVPDERIFPNKQMTGEVESINQSANTQIEKGKLVLSVSGAGAEWVQEQLQIGERITIDISLEQGLNEARHVISGNSTLGYVLLKDGMISPKILDQEIPLNHDRHPRTMIAVKQGRLYIFVVDGRQPGHSNGITLAEGAFYLQNLGMEAAINIDGGGSTTCYIRQPGDELPTIVNRPSDGFERAVGNGLFFQSIAPISTLNTLIIKPDSPILVLAGSKVQIEVKGQDRFLNAVTVRPTKIICSIEGNIGYMEGNNTFKAGTRASCGKLNVRSGDVTQQCSIQVIEEIARFEIHPTTIVVEPNGEIEFDIHAFDHEDRKVWISPDQLDWSIHGGIGSVSERGVLQASQTVKQGKIIAKYKELETEIQVSVGKAPVILADFDTLQGLTVYGEKAVANSVTLTLAPRPEPVRFGTFSGKLTYDFTNISGAAKAVIQLLDSNDQKGLEVEGEPYRFGLWVYGDSNNHWLRIGISDANGESRSLSLTEPGGLNWTGWKYVYADIADNTAFPITVRYLFITETNDANKNAGTLYFDRLRAEYVKIDEDLEGPVFSHPIPSPNQIVKDDHPIVRLTLKDNESGVEPSSIQVWINGKVVEHTFDSATGVVSAQIASSSQKRSYQVVVEAADRSGNPMVPKASWRFERVPLQNLNES
ncbi:phosphodiester glycosidase family protein [Lederbergia galactosidilytica]|uniref:Phosphodiester glycosidase domain-containing protein n=1 Tax=Lederbergia galactosidilytica TaxID=217031 RepID=A0A177ZIH4_9BACI|nr:phosphodiester glycosidase family protein [Lederbergia galactosidilytica]OAK67413.1 hypothetical protein ABB05_19915 [Lederbergia galactosidilytica]